MNCILLAAGTGSRLFPLTKNIPKCMLELGNGCTLLERTIDIICDVDPLIDITIVVGFKRKKICEKIENIQIIENPFFRVTNSIASLWFAQRKLETDVLIINSDVCFSKELFQSILTCKKENFVVLDSSKKCTDADYKVVVDGDNVINMGKNIPFDNFFGEYAGITRLNTLGTILLKKKINQMLYNEIFDTWYETALVHLIKEDKFPIEFYDICGQKWIEVDTADDLSKAKKIFET
ncbi:phosphocholine cytidylyltransferase family protein [Methanospirillum sp.]